MKPVRARQKPPPQVGPQLSTGFPSPAEDYEEPPLDLHDLTVTNPLATYFLRADTDSMQRAHIQRGDILVVDRSLAPADGRVVIAIIDDVFHVLRCRVSASASSLVLEDDHHAIDAEIASVWGVVTYVVHKA